MNLIPFLRGIQQTCPETGMYGPGELSRWYEEVGKALDSECQQPELKDLSPAGVADLCEIFEKWRANPW